ncbi:F510_1955 family glycosylhydrolase [Bacillus rubiinfantis]|uniref:F510_1955 family glycosylhydrolase n=1 Tax=Bacillus rubiinfantis TaxID=1499680 RepID=UPI0005A6209E|nr:exo-alpha-sialidase [Bacillus rubiinfantis]
MKKRLWVSILLLLIISTAGCTNNEDSKNSKNAEKSNIRDTPYKISEVTSLSVSRILGVGYPGNDHALYLASNRGLKLYRDGKWYKTTTNNHQYMGFQAIKHGFIASGHPQKGTGLKDPLGIIKSSDKGESFEKLAFYGKTNFYFMAAGYSGNGIYVISENQNESLHPGVNYSNDGGESWEKSELTGFDADSFGMLAVNPENDDILAMATRTGIYYSVNNGNTMKRITEPYMVTAITFLGESLLYSSVENNKILLKVMRPGASKQQTLQIPFLDYDNPITYLAVNSRNIKQIAFTTYKNDVYESLDGGKKWTILLKDGKKERE